MNTPVISAVLASALVASTRADVLDVRGPSSVFTELQPAPGLPELAHETWRVQALSADPVGRLHLGFPASITVLDSAY